MDHDTIISIEDLRKGFLIKTGLSTPRWQTITNSIQFASRYCEVGQT